MNIKTTIVIITLIACSCSKERAFENKINTQSNRAAIVVDTVPINDLGQETFNGYTGGLYPGGVNNPRGRYALDLLSTCKNINPIDTFGNPSATNGKILFVSLGFSTGSQNMLALQKKTIGNPLTNPKLSLLSFNKGSGTGMLNNIMNPNDPYWDFVSTRINETKTSYRQVQIIYLETEDSTKITSFPGRPIQVKNELESCFRLFKQKFPNVKLVYLLARTTTFGNWNIINREPCPYYLGWACKWAIEDQIKGVTGTKYKGPNAVSPMITWGFYQWAQEKPRVTDGFKWTVDLMKDGLHANDIGKDTLAKRFQKFLLNDKYAKNWYAKQ